MRYIKTLLSASIVSISMGMSFNANAVPVDIAFVVDQSASMGSEFGWIPNVISSIDTALQGEAVVTSTRYGIAGYMEGVGNEVAGASTGFTDEYHDLAYVDLTPNVATVSGAATLAGSDLRAFTERGYHAADWSRSGFSWAADAVKVMILITDEAADQGSTIADVGMGSDEANLGKLLSDDNILLNVITNRSLFSQWDQAVFDQSGTYKGLFDLGFLRSNPADFTTQFVAAKVGEITGTVTTVPNPPTLLLVIAGLLGMRRFQKAQT
ncbi:MAG TPA: hypothetical protein ENI97_13355 [Gammaproteobacteria bacterium]|nr:hypothetical protein [Gammaproteobacteria bacterium]